MRHPFWRWTGWLSIGLTGCLHGQDWRAAVTKPTTRPVSDRIESRPQPKVVGPFRNGQSKFVPSAEVTTLPAVATHAAANKSVQQIPRENTSASLAKKSESRPRNTDVTPVGHEVSSTAPTTPPTVAPPASAGILRTVPPEPASPAPVLVELQRTGPFAEFERTIPMRRAVVASPSVPQAEPVEVIVVEKVTDEIIERSEPEKPALPIITPAGAIISGKPVAVHGSQSRILELESPVADDRPRGLFSKSAVPAKELSDVTDTTTATAKDLPTADAEPSVRPQDVSVLVEQVFEDLRQRRMNDARQRTEWLKQLVLKRAPANPANAVEDEATTETDGTRSGEPRRLNVDPQATAVEKAVPETFFDDEESTSSK